MTPPNGFDIAGCVSAATAIEVDLARLTASLTEAQFHASPRLGGWSVGYGIEHLVLIAQAFLPQWEKALRKGEEASYPNVLRATRYAWWQRRLLRIVENSPVVNCESRQCFVPYLRRSSEETLGAFLTAHRDLVSMLIRTRDVRAPIVKVQSPSVSWIRYELGFSFDLVLAHERRHLRQAWQIREQLMLGL